MDIQLYNHDSYGEGWEAMANHVHDMTGLQRQLFEDCYPAGNKVCAPAFNAQTLPRRQRIEWLTEQLPHTLAEIQHLLECWEVIEATPEMIDTFISWCQQRSPKASLDYFSDLAFQLKDAVDEPDDHGLYTFWLATSDDEFHRKILWKDRHDRFYSAQTDFINEDESFVEPEPEPFEPAPPEFRYRRLPDEGNGEPYFSMREVEKLRDVLKAFKKREHLSLLLRIGKALYKSRQLLYQDSESVWNEYNLAKRRCNQDLPDIAKRLFDRIRLAKSLAHLKFLSAYVYHQFNGKMFNNTEPNEELTQLHPLQKAWVWNYIKKRKREVSS